MRNLTLSQVEEYITNMDLALIRRTMCSQPGWRNEEALLCEKMYKNYLRLKKKYGEFYMLPPSKEIDEFWHNHILDTQRYHKDCQIIFGKYLHHYPYFGLNNDADELAEAFEQTKMLYLQEFKQELTGI